MQKTKVIPEIQRNFYKRLKGKPIAVHAELVRALGTVNAGYLMSQFLYWHSIVRSMGRDVFYKSIEELEVETGLSRKQQANAIKICEKKGVLKHWVHRAEGSPTRHFRVDVLKLAELCGLVTQKDKPTGNSETKPPVPLGQNNTEITTDNKQINNINKFNQLKREVLSKSSLKGNTI